MKFCGQFVFLVKFISKNKIVEGVKKFWVGVTFVQAACDVSHRPLRCCEATANLKQRRRRCRFRCVVQAPVVIPLLLHFAQNRLIRIRIVAVRILPWHGTGATRGKLFKVLLGLTNFEVTTNLQSLVSRYSEHSAKFLYTIV